MLMRHACVGRGSDPHHRREVALPRAPAWYTIGVRMGDGGDRRTGVSRRAWLRGAAAAGVLGACEGPRGIGVPFDPRVLPIDGGFAAYSGV